MKAREAMGVSLLPIRILDRVVCGDDQRFRLIVIITLPPDGLGGA